MKKALRLLLAFGVLQTIALPGLAPRTFAAATDPVYVSFRADLPAGAAYAIEASRLHPTQFALGWREVVYKAELIRTKSPAELAAYLKKKDVPVVIGPGGVPYMTDGHHTIRALITSAQPDQIVYGHILANWSDLEPAEFWTRMRAANNTRLNDATGRGPLAPAHLPVTLTDMQSDPYRGLAWAVLAAGGFAERKDVFFQEFFWADFFRNKISWNDDNDADFARATQEAVALAHTPAAAALPGWLPASK
jgi:hypothetical protein